MEANASPTQSSVRSPRYISLDRALPVTVACQACRSRHQKCDGVLPICLRCKKGNRSCSYAPSNRGRSVAHLHPEKAKVSEVIALASCNNKAGLNVRFSRQCCSLTIHTVVIMLVLIFLSSSAIVIFRTCRKRRKDTAKGCNRCCSCNGLRGRCSDARSHFRGFSRHVFPATNL